MSNHKIIRLIKEEDKSLVENFVYTAFPGEKQRYHDAALATGIAATDPFSNLLKDWRHWNISVDF